MTEDKALELWREWWNDNNGSPWAWDDGIADTCYFCNRTHEHKEDPEHYDDCLYLKVIKLLGKEPVPCEWPLS